MIIGCLVSRYGSFSTSVVQGTTVEMDTVRRSMRRIRVKRQVLHLDREMNEFQVVKMIRDDSKNIFFLYRRISMSFKQVSEGGSQFAGGTEIRRRKCQASQPGRRKLNTKCLWRILSAWAPRGWSLYQNPKLRSWKRPRRCCCPLLGYKV